MPSNKIFSFNLDGQSDDNIKGALLGLSTKFDGVIEWARQVDVNNVGMQENILRLIVSFDTLVSLCIDSDIFSEEDFNSSLETRLESVRGSMPSEESVIIVPKKKIFPSR
jgi:hypothetical protein